MQAFQITDAAAASDPGHRAPLSHLSRFATPLEILRAEGGDAPLDPERLDALHDIALCLSERAGPQGFAELGHRALRLMDRVTGYRRSRGKVTGPRDVIAACDALLAELHRASACARGADG